MKTIAKSFRVNLAVPNRDLLVIDSEGNKIGVISRDEALKIAQERELDLVEIAPLANPPVAKIVEFQKFRYEESKKEQQAKKNAKEVELKEIWLSPRIAEHDLQTRLRRATQFIEDGDRVLLRIKFKGREMAHTQDGFVLVQKIYDQFGDKISVERAAKLEGRSITTIIGKGKGGSNKTNEDQTQN